MDKSSQDSVLSIIAKLTSVLDANVTVKNVDNRSFFCHDNSGNLLAVRNDSSRQNKIVTKTCFPQEKKKASVQDFSVEKTKFPEHSNKRLGRSDDMNTKSFTKYVVPEIRKRKKI